LIGDQSRGKLYFSLLSFFIFILFSLSLPLFTTLSLSLSQPTSVSLDTFARLFPDLPSVLYFTPREDTAGPWRRSRARGVVAETTARHDRTAKVYRSVKVQTCLCTTSRRCQSRNFTRRTPRKTNISCDWSVDWQSRCLPIYFARNRVRVYTWPHFFSLVAVYVFVFDFDRRKPVSWSPRSDRPAVCRGGDRKYDYRQRSTRTFRRNGNSLSVK